MVELPFSGEAVFAEEGSGVESNGGFKVPGEKRVETGRGLGRPPKKLRMSPRLNYDPKKLEDINGSTHFVGEPVPEEEARRRWPHHYENQGKNTKGPRCNDEVDDDDELFLDVKCHYLGANISGCNFNIGDCAYVKGEEGEPNYVARILEFFETMQGENFCRVQWFFRAEDTVMQEQGAFQEKKRLFESDLMNDNLLDCIVSKVRVVQVPSRVDLNSKPVPSCYFYYDMKYTVEYSTFCTLEADASGEKSDYSSSNCSVREYDNGNKRKSPQKQVHSNSIPNKTELELLDLYSGCGGMSTGLCLGAQAAGVNLVTRWAVDFSETACHSLKLNHPETQVRNEAAGDFFELLKEWDKLCKKYALKVGKNSHPGSRISSRSEYTTDTEDGDTTESEEYEVLKLVDICYGDPNDNGKHGLNFKVRWKGYGASDDTWEPIEELSKCEEKIQDFVTQGFKSKILPLPGHVDVLCGGPPCQGISGYNRFRNFEAPLEDDRNQQIIVFMNIVEFLKPKYVLMENVADILMFAKGTLARYAISRLVAINYQARLGIMAAGCYGLPQFRLRVFLWGCLPYEKLPQFPLPTHEVVLRYGPPLEFERNVVGYDEGQPRELEKELYLEDILSDLPAVTNTEDREKMPYERGPQTEFQRFLRAPTFEMSESKMKEVKDTKPMLYDHRPLQLSEDDYLRVCRVPKRKGANFRDFPGVIVGADNIARLDPTMERVLLPSGKSLVPDYALNLTNGKSLRPFARLWWDETLSTVLTAPDTHSKAIIHPEQDRVLTIRECARAQGFPDCYRFCGSIKDRYRQIGNAVAVPVSRALGYTLGMAMMKQGGDDPLTTLPPKFSLSYMPQQISSSSSVVEE